MSLKTLLDPEVKARFLKASHANVVSHLKALENGLTRYSKNPSIVPPRTKALTPSGDAIHLFMPVVDDVYCGVKTLGYNEKSGLGFVGSINVLDPTNGLIRGVVDAKQVTGIRTALSSHIGLSHLSHKFDGIEKLNVTVFGSGLQAFWHSFVCAKLFSAKQVDLNIVHRSKKLDDRELCNACSNICSVNYVKIDSSDIGQLCRKSHVIFGTIPTSEPSIKEHFFRQVPEEIDSTSFTYISLIGSYQPHMHECDNALVSAFRDQNVKIIVDSAEHTLLESGELIDAHIEPSNLIEIGKLASTHDSCELEAKIGPKSITLCKIVGLAIMDIVTAKKLIEDDES